MQLAAAGDGVVESVWLLLLALICKLIFTIFTFGVKVRKSTITLGLPWQHKSMACHHLWYMCWPEWTEFWAPPIVSLLRVDALQGSELSSFLLIMLVTDIVEMRDTFADLETHSGSLWHALKGSDPVYRERRNRWVRSILATSLSKRLRSSNTWGALTKSVQLSVQHGKDDLVVWGEDRLKLACEQLVRADRRAWGAAICWPALPPAGYRFEELCLMSAIWCIDCSVDTCLGISCIIHF